jgi:hypothetical protein
MKNDSDTVSDDQSRLLDELQHLLEKQIEFAQQGNINGVERLSRESDFLAGKVAKAGILGSPGFEERRSCLEKLYKELHLNVAAQKAETGEFLSRLRISRRALATYRNNNRLF